MQDATAKKKYPLQGQLDITIPEYNECIKKLIHIFFCSPTINNEDMSINAREASQGQTLPLAFKQTSAGSHSPRLPWGRDTPVSDHTVLLGSVSFKPSVPVVAQRQGETQRQREKNETKHISLLARFRRNHCVFLELLSWCPDIQINGQE